MKARGAAIQGALAVIGLATAYATWQRAPETSPGEVVVLDAGKNDLAKIRYEDGEGKWVELEPGPGKEGVWMRVSARGFEVVGGKPSKTPQQPERFLRGSEAAERLFEHFAPLRATRALGALPADKLKEVGLEAPKKKIEVTARGGKTVYLIGTPPAGVSSPYVKDERDGRVYVLSGGVVSELESAPGWLVERRLHAFQPADFDGVTVTSGGKKRELVVTGTPGTPGAKLASKATPDKADDLAKNWHEKVWRAAPTEVLGQKEVPKLGEPQVAVRVDYARKGKAAGWIEIASVSRPKPIDQSAATPPPGPTTEHYARTEHTAGWVKLPGNSDELIKEAEKVVAAQ